MVPVIALVVALVPLAVTGGGVYRPVVRRAYPPLQRRLEFVGAAPLLALKCPSDLKECSSTSRAMGMCCPKTTTCVLSFCCPTDQSCADLVTTTPTCSDPEFDLFTWEDSLWGVQYFCCEKGELGYLTKGANRGSEACGKPPLGVASSLLATAVSPSVTLDPGAAKETVAGKKTTRTITSPPTETTVVSTAANGDAVTVASTIRGAVTVSTGVADTAGSSGPPTGGGLPTTAIAGIAVGVVGGLALLALAVWLGIRHGKKVASAGAAAGSAAAGGPAGSAAVTSAYAPPHPVPSEQQHKAPPQQQYQPVAYTDPNDGVAEKDGAGYHPHSDLGEMDGNSVRRY